MVIYFFFRLRMIWIRWYVHATNSTTIKIPWNMIEGFYRVMACSTHCFAVSYKLFKFDIESIEFDFPKSRYKRQDKGNGTDG